MSRLTAVSEELKLALAEREAADSIEIEPPQAPSVVAPAPRHRTRTPRFRPGKSHYAAAREIIANFSQTASPASQRAYRIQQFKAFIGPMIFGGLFGMLAAGELLVFKYFPADSPTTSMLNLAAGFLAALLLIRLSKLPGRAIHSALAAGDYRRAAGILETAEKFGLTFFTPSRSFVLLRAGRFADAEAWLRTNLIASKRAIRSLDLVDYASALHGLGESESAEKLNYIAADFLPGRPEPLIAQADILLKRQNRADGALLLLDAAFKKAKKKSAEFLAVHHARKALALNQLNDIEESDRLLARALRGHEQLPIPVRARLQLIQAEILFARGEKLEAAACARECMKLDPHGATIGDARIVLVASSLRTAEHLQSAAA